VLAAAAAASEASIGAPMTFASFHVPASSSKPSPGELGVDFTCVAVPGGTYMWHAHAFVRHQPSPDELPLRSTLHSLNTAGITVPGLAAVWYRMWCNVC
jgi:hypothetical protein